MGNIYKNYKDEIWGKLINASTFSYNKKKVLNHYKNNILKKTFRLKTKFNYFKFRFLRVLRYSLFSFKVSRKINKNLTFFLLFRSFLHTSKVSNNTVEFSNRRNRRNIFVYSWRNFGIVNRTKRWRKAIKFVGVKTLNLMKINSFLHFVESFEINDNQNLTEIYKSMLTLFNNKRPLLQMRRANRQLLNKFKYVIRRTLKIKRKRSFFYSIHIASPYKKEKKLSLYGLRYIYYKKISTFYGFKKISNFISQYSKFATNKCLFYIKNFLECRVTFLIHNINFLPSLYFIKNFIRNGNVFINNTRIDYPNYILKVGEILTVSKKYHYFIYNYLKHSLMNKQLFVSNPNYLEVDYKIFTAMLISNPSEIELKRPLSFDLYTRFPSVSK